MCLHTGVHLDKCSLDHSDGCFVTSSQDTAIGLWKLFPTLPNCTCKEVLQRKGVGVGWKNGNKRLMSKTVKAYLTEYWRKKGLMNEESGHQFNDEIERMSFLIHRGTHYKMNDLVVVRPDGVEECEEMDHFSWTWKAKIMSIFVHEFMGVHEVFFRAEYFDQVPSSEGSCSAKQSELSSMRILKSNPRQHFGDDTRPVNQLLHKFIKHPIPNRKGAIVAYELCDLSVRSHLLSDGHRSVLPPWPEVGKLYWFEASQGSWKFNLGVVRRVLLPRHLQIEETGEVEGDQNHPYIGLVHMSQLKKTVGKEREYQASMKDFPLSWKCLGEYVMSNYHMTRIKKGIPISWGGV